MSVIIKGKNPRKPHTVRYWVDGRQRERSFATAREAQDFKIKTDHDTRAQIFVDDKLGREDFGAAVDAWIGRHAVGDSTKDGYRVTARASRRSRAAPSRRWPLTGTGSLTCWQRTWGI
jgi:hypothetical protein